MKASKFGAIVASTVVGLAGTMAVAQSARAETKGCYRPHCGSSVKGHEGKCGGTMIEGLTSQGACEAAGGAWVTAAEAKKFEKKSE